MGPGSELLLLGEVLAQNRLVPGRPAVGLFDSRTESPGSSLVDGKRARRRPVAPSYRALEAGAQERKTERALEKELRLDFPKKLLKTTTSFCYLYLVSPIFSLLVFNHFHLV